MIWGTPENEIFALRAPTSKAFGGMPLHNFTLNIIQIPLCVCVKEREREAVSEDGDERDVRETEASPWQPPTPPLIPFRRELITHHPFHQVHHL